MTEQQNVLNGVCVDVLSDDVSGKCQYFRKPPFPVERLHLQVAKRG